MSEHIQKLNDELGQLRNYVLSIIKLNNEQEDELSNLVFYKDKYQKA